MGLPLSSGVETEVDVGAGISSHSFPAMFNCLRKNGQSLVKITRDSFASAEEIGTGEDLITAVATSDAGNARRFRVVGVAVADAGVEKSLE